MGFASFSSKLLEIFVLLIGEFGIMDGIQFGGMF